MFLKWLKKKSPPQQSSPAHILQNVAPGLGLVGLLQEATPDQRCGLLTKAFETVSRSIETIKPELRDLLESYHRSSALSEHQIAAACAFAESADEKYFALEEHNPNLEAGKNWFNNARLATALADAAGPASWLNAADAIYELSVIPDDSSELFQLVKSELEKTPSS